MPRIRPDDLRQGMVLSKAVTNANGLVMIVEDTELTDLLIRRIQNINIDYVYVKGTSQEGAPLEEMLTGLDQRFKNTDGVPHMDIIKNAVRRHLEELYG